MIRTSPMFQWAAAALFLFSPSIYGEPSLTPIADIFEGESDVLVIQRTPFGTALPDWSLQSSHEKIEKDVLEPEAFRTYFNRLARKLFFEEGVVVTAPVTEIPMGDFLRFSPPMDRPLRQWQVDLINHEGNVIKTWKGQGAPPAVVAWNGADEGWSRFQAGQPVTFVFSAVDDSGAPVKITPASLTIPVFMREDSSGVMVHASPLELFHGTNILTLSDKADHIWRSVLSHVGERAAWPLSVEIYSRDAAKADQMKNLLLTSLALSFKQRPDDISCRIQNDSSQAEEVVIKLNGKKP